MFCLLPLLSGCIGGPQHPAATQPATAIPAEQADPQFWLAKSPVEGIASVDFDRLWNACSDTARDYLYQLDRQDYRGGVLTTRPMVSKQFFEFWRKDAGTTYDVAQDSLQTIRRTLRFDVVRSDDGYFIAHPKVLIERLSLAGRRITTVTQYRLLFNASAAGPSSIVDTENPVNLPTRYWYALGRDEEMERQVADQVKARLR